MTRRLLAFPAVLIAVITLVTLAAPPVGHADQQVPALVITAYNGGSPITYTTPKTPVGRSRSAGRLEQRRHARHPTRAPAAARHAALSEPTRSSPRGRSRSRTASQRGENAIGTFRNDFATPRVPPDLAHRRSAGRPHAGVTPEAETAARVRATAARSATDRSTRPKTSRSTTAASRAASSARCCASSTATATASCRRRAWSPSATR